MINIQTISKKFQDIVLINCVVNLKKNFNSFFKIDKLLKLFNFIFKIFWKKYSQFFKNND